MHPLFASHLTPDLKEQLEKIFFFNDRQSFYIDEILQTVKLFGDPKMKETDFGITIVLPKVPHAQCLFGIAPLQNKLLGVGIYTREVPEELEILHIATCSSWQKSDEPEANLEMFISKFAEIARRIRGIRKLRLPYGKAIFPIKE